MRTYISCGLVFIALLFSECNPVHNERNSNDSVYCINEISLFSAHDSLYKIELDYNQEPDSILDYIESVFGEDLCWQTVSFGLVCSGHEAVSVSLLKSCNDGTVFCFKKYPEVSIYLNQSGIPMIGSDILPANLDTIRLWIDKDFPNDSDHDLEAISLKWCSETPKDSIEKAIDKIIDGYLMNYEELSIRLFSKSICDLSTSQVDSLKSLLPFNIRLGLNKEDARLRHHYD